MGDPISSPQRRLAVFCHRIHLFTSVLQSFLRRRNGHCDWQARTISSSGQYWGWLRVNLSVTTQSESSFAFERAPPRRFGAESLSRQLRRSAVWPGCAVVELAATRRGSPGCGSTSKIPERSLLARTPGLRALAVLDGWHAVRPNCSLEQQRGLSFGTGTGGSMFGTRRLRSPASPPRAAQLEC